ncbi:MAG: methylamine utilization protein MauE [Gammaproteobacteria bacterium]|nr:methylamine utilization protein MauE [Gammaproteobacteria bacterium]
MPDIVIQHVAAASLAIVFMVGAWQKLRDRIGFEIALDNYDLLPAALVKPVAWLLPAFEFATGLALVSPWRTNGGVMALLLLGFVTAGVVVNLLRGRTDVGCGCGGIEDEQLLSWALVARNGVLALGACATLGAGVARPLAWLDYVTVVGATLSAYALYVAANQLIANRPRLARLRRPA